MFTLTNPCSKCRSPNDRDHRRYRYCRACHAAYMREHRPKHSELKPEAKMKANARAMANTYQKRGLIEKRQCEVCWTKPGEKHHPDYKKPLDVRWLCREHHLNLHVESRNVRCETSQVRLQA